MTKSLFLNYRRGETSGSAGRMHDLLSQRLEGVKIFMDVDSLEPGVDFAGAIEEQLAGCDYFLAMVGPNWASARNPGGGRRLDDPNDYVRLEIEAALRRGIRVVPVLVDGATMPKVDELPESLRPFTGRNAFEVSHHKFAADVAELSEAISRALGIGAKREVVGARHEPSPSWADALLSARGRFSRKQFWLWSLALMAPTFAMQSLILLIVGSFGDYVTGKRIPFQHLLIVQAVALPMWWCTFAVTAKRLHDFNAGRGFIAALVVLAAITFASAFRAESIIEASSSSPRALGFAQGLSSALLVLVMAIFTAIGLVPGTPGPNRYGFEPGAR